ncbi:MAG: hypothetical protein NTY12_00715 [Candidatus Falkowbacteria bacterium]|nr:hypothetical protein [Candidatus Falkowbacteria bacterium]
MDNNEEKKPKEDDPVSIEGRKGKIKICGRKFFNVPGECYMVVFDDKENYPPWQWTTDKIMVVL